MGHHSEAFIGIDTSKLKNAVAIAEGGRGGEVRYWGEIDTSEAAGMLRGIELRIAVEVKVAHEPLDQLGDRRVRGGGGRRSAPG